MDTARLRSGLVCDITFQYGVLTTKYSVISVCTLSLRIKYTYLLQVASIRVNLLIHRYLLDRVSYLWWVKSLRLYPYMYRSWALVEKLL